MGLFNVLFGKPKRRRKKATRRPAARASVDRQAKAWIDKDNRRRARERHRTRMSEVRQVKAADRLKRREDRERAYLRKTGWAESEIDELFHGLGFNPSRRRERMTAACGSLCIRNPSAEEMSDIFHNSPRFTRDGKTVIGTLENVRYRAPAGSSRGGVLWDHQVLDRGALRPRAKRRPLLVADPNSGRVSISGGDMRFQPSHGLVG